MLDVVVAPRRELEPNGPSIKGIALAGGTPAIGSLPQVEGAYAAVWERKSVGYGQLPFEVRVAAETALGHPRPQPPAGVTGPQHARPAAEATTFLFKIAEEEARSLWCECGARRMSLRSTLAKNGL